MTKSQVTFLPPSNLLNFKLEILNLMYEHLWWWYNLILKIFWIFYLICLYLNDYLWFIYRTMDRGNCLGMIIIHIETMAFYNLWFPFWNLICVVYYIEWLFTNQIWCIHADITDSHYTTYSLRVFHLRCHMYVANFPWVK